MIDHLAAVLALRARALDAFVVSTGLTTEKGWPLLTEAGAIIVTDCGLSAVAAGYERTTGSFITDGFAVGQEVTPVGFTDTSTGVITSVTALALGIAGGRTAEATSTDKALYVGLPTVRAWENLDLTPTGGAWYIDEDYLPGPVQQITLGALGTVETLPQYVLKLYGLAGVGIRPLYKAADALLDAFPPRLNLTLSTGDQLIVRTNPAPYRGQLLTVEGGWAVIPITIPLVVRSANIL